MTITIEIRTSNAAFGEDAYARGAEVARILREVARQFETGGTDELAVGSTERALRDANGNKVGTLIQTGEAP